MTTSGACEYMCGSYDGVPLCLLCFASAPCRYPIRLNYRFHVSALGCIRLIRARLVWHISTHNEACDAPRRKEATRVLIYLIKIAPGFAGGFSHLAIGTSGTRAIDGKMPAMRRSLLTSRA